MTFAVECRGLGKYYRVYDRASDQLVELLTNRPRHRRVWALHDVHLTVEPGETLGVIGFNGSGKSTLLQLLAGTVQPSAGVARVKGRIGALLELGAAFHRDFTGRENVLMTGAMLGLSPREMQARLSEIEAFAEVGEYFDRPVKTYSNGMYVRVAFAAVSHVDADVMLIDEALAVGDVGFQHRCLLRFHQMQREGKTIVLVSHSPETIKSLCTRAIRLDGGRLIANGSPEEVVNGYLADIQSRVRLEPEPAQDAASPAPAAAEPDLPVVAGFDRSDGRFGNGDAEVVGIELFDPAGQPTRTTVHGAHLDVVVTVRFKRALPQPVVGITIRNRLGVDVTRTNTLLEGNDIGPVEADDVVTCRFRLQIPALYPGGYAISPAVANGTMAAYEMCDWVENAVVVQVEASREVHGQLMFPCTVAVSRRRAGVPHPAGLETAPAR